MPDQCDVADVLCVVIRHRVNLIVADVVLPGRGAGRAPARACRAEKYTVTDP
jgi:hypothetical protein